jgi:hypothetical protein
MTTTTLNPADKFSDIVLSNGNLTATYTPAAGQGGGSTSGNRNVRATQSGTAGRYFEVTFGTLVTGPGLRTAGIGLANASQGLTSYPGDPNGIGWFANTYVEWPGSGTGNTFASFAAGDVLGVLLESSDAKFYKNGILVGTATQLPSGALYPVISRANATDSATANFGATPLAYLPVGATSWDGTRTNAPPPPTTGLNPQDKFADIVLSNNNLTATYTTARSSGNVNIRGAQSGVAGRYFEVKFSNIATGQPSGPGVGVCNTTQSLSTFPQDPNGAAWFASAFFDYPGSFGNWATFAAGDIIGVLLEASDAKFYKNGVLVGTATSLPSGPLYPVISLANNGEAATINVGATPLSYLPVGASSWDGSQFGGTGTGTGGQTTTSTFALNPLDKAPTVVLSNVNLTATTTTTQARCSRNRNWCRRQILRSHVRRDRNRHRRQPRRRRRQRLADPNGGSYPGNPNGVGWFSSGYTEWPGSGTGFNFGIFVAGSYLAFF